MDPNMLTHYREAVVPALTEKLGYKNVMEVPRITKIVVNSGIGSVDDRKAVAEDTANDVATITGQKPVVTKARNAIANFKLRAGDLVGVKVTLRNRQMYEFYERLVKIAIPTIRDFRGVSFKAFDGRGNYTLGINDHTIFPEIELDKVKRTIGFDICIVTSANTDEEAKELLTQMGMPFRKPQTSEDQAA